MASPHLHLGCPSGISGDMFCAALLDLGVPLTLFQEAVQSLCLPEKVLLRTERSVRGGLAGTRFLVEEQGHHHHHDHHHGRNWAEIRDLLKKSKLAREVRDSALAMFQRVAEAEAKLHGVPVETVHFHEVGAVDSIIDLVCAAAGVHRLAELDGRLALAHGRPQTDATPGQRRIGRVVGVHEHRNDGQGHILQKPAMDEGIGMAFMRPLGQTGDGRDVEFALHQLFDQMQRQRLVARIGSGRHVLEAPHLCRAV
ncbi:MAG: DUF111 family protein, partial [Verrucomicrobia bacterium]|nr:DUF111 family protein [Verrucomicrobiota bacterium]